jgi:hypothetical protein
MNDVNTGRLRIPRSRGAMTGFLLILLGIWGGLIPFIGPYFNFAYTPDVEWTWTAARGWLEVLPAAATVLGGLLLLVSRNRAAALFGGWLTVLAGGWFVIGQLFAGPLQLGIVGTPVASSEIHRALLQLAYFYGLGAAIVFLGAVALGRVSVLSVRDVSHAQRPVTPAAAPVTEPTAAPQHAAKEETKEEEAATEEEAEPRHRGLGAIFGRRRTTTPAH